MKKLLLLVLSLLLLSLVSANIDPQTDHGIFIKGKYIIDAVVYENKG